MTRVSSNSFHDATINNIQDSFAELTRLQNQLQTQKLLSKPSEDPVTANQAIRLERNLTEIRQYKKNVETGSDFLVYSDQILSNIDSAVNTAIEKLADLNPKIKFNIYGDINGISFDKLKILKKLAKKND